MDDTLYESISAFLQSPDHLRTWPSEVKTKDEKRNFRRKCEKFSVNDGTLHYQHPKNGLLRVIKTSEKQTILSACHSALGDGGHLGIDKCRQKVTSRYFWPAMNADIKEYIGNISENYSINVEFEYKLYAISAEILIRSHEPSLSSAGISLGQVNLAKITGFESDLNFGMVFDLSGLSKTVILIILCFSQLLTEFIIMHFTNACNIHDICTFIFQTPVMPASAITTSARALQCSIPFLHQTSRSCSSEWTWLAHCPGLHQATGNMCSHYP